MSEQAKIEQAEPLPDFENPPVVEVVLGVQFDPIKRLKTPQLGLLWQQFKEQLPEVQEKPPLEPVTERFGMARKPPGGGIMFQFLDAPPTPRCWFLKPDGTELIQVQPDRFIHNWRKVGEGDQYPRYEKLRRAFSKELEAFIAFVEGEELGEFLPNQWEVTYINHIISGEGWITHADLHKVIALFCPRHSDEFLASPEEARLDIKYIIPDTSGEPMGRLHAVVDPAYRLKDDVPMFSLCLTARGIPQGHGIGGILGDLDKGREWVVRGFASITTPEMHHIWRRRNGR